MSLSRSVNQYPQKSVGEEMEMGHNAAHMPANQIHSRFFLHSFNACLTPFVLKPPVQPTRPAQPGTLDRRVHTQAESIAWIGNTCGWFLQPGERSEIPFHCTLESRVVFLVQTVVRQGKQVGEGAHHHGTVTRQVRWNRYSGFIS